MHTRLLTWMALIGILLSACSAGPAPTEAPAPTATTAPPVVLPTAAVAPLPQATMIQPPTLPTVPVLPAPVLPAAGCVPEATASTVINVRNGPGTIYSVVGAMQEGEKAQIDGKNADGSWWYIRFPGAVDGHAWVAGSVTTSACINTALPVIPASELPEPFMAAIVNVTVGVEPSEITIPGCTEAGPRMTAGAIITASGPMEVTYYFEIDGGSTRPRTLTFTEYGSRQVSETFKPDAVAGSHTVRLFIEGLNMRTWEYQARYKVNC